MRASKHPVAEFLVIVVAGFLIQIWLLWFRALVLRAYVEWFVRPAWPGVPVLAMSTAMGLVLLPQIWKTTTGDKEPVQIGFPWERLARGAVNSFLLSAVMALLGYLVAALGGSR